MAITVPQKERDVEKLTLKEEQMLDEKIQQLMDERDGVELSQGVNVIAKREKADINREISRLIMAKQKRGITRAEGPEREEVLKQIQALEVVLRKGMPSFETFQNSRKKDGITYLRVKRWCDERNLDTPFSKKWNSMAKQWKSLRRRLEPDDPQIGDMTYLFLAKDNW